MYVLQHFYNKLKNDFNVFKLCHHCGGDINEYTITFINICGGQVEN